MKVIVHPSRLAGTVTAAASKSSMQRACAAALLKGGQTILSNPGKSNDDLAAIDVIRKLGAAITYNESGDLVIDSSGIHPADKEVDCGESGLGIRMFTPIAALSDQPITLNGSGSLLTRPMDFFDEILPKLGVQVRSDHGKLPLQIRGSLKPADIEVDGSLSSQFLTGLLMAYGAANASDVTITVTNLKSKPYIDLTLEVMDHFGWHVENKNYEKFHFPKKLNAESLTLNAECLRHNAESETPNPQPQTNSIPPLAGQTPDSGLQTPDSTLSYAVQSDWSGAAFLLVAGAIAGPITVKGLDIGSAQADKAILQALMDCGAALSIQQDRIEIGPMPLKAFHFNATDCPDLFPPLVALAAYCEGTTVIEGVKRLTHKESNRALTLQEEFGKLGIEIRLQEDLMLISGGTGVKAAVTHSHHDHRIAMANAVAALRATGEVEIGDAEAIDKSYPEFYRHLQQLGAAIQIHNP
ncbi:MAG: 3-phosphoshikimate 1-carboxyvinyltransferase [Chitinophagaceae bacterium]|nr:3-phosphoshikimate 1-carboxyvinyltransferase [Chitinophagaceae bacterium]